MAKARKGGLGKGLEALFVDNAQESNGAQSLRISEIEPNKDQPRKQFDEAALAELAASIREHGVLQPILVRPMDNGSYQIIAGERRWRAARLAGLTQMPAIVKEFDDDTTLQIALIENLQREDLNPVEEAQGYQLLMDRYGYTQEQLATQMGKSRSAVANTLRLLQLPKEVLQLLAAGKLQSGHARALLALGDPQEMAAVARKASEGAVTVREIERMAKRGSAVQRKSSKKEEQAADWGENFYKEMEIALGNALARKVKITHSGENGTIEISFYSREELCTLANRLSGQKGYW